jgi:hypothetical protein
MTKNHKHNGKYPKEIRDYAKTLYLTPRPEGGHQYTLRDIAIHIKNKFPQIKTKPDHTTIRRWATVKKGNGRSWRQIWDEATLNGITEAQQDIEEVEEAQNQEEAITEKIAMFNRRLSLIGMDLIVKGYKWYSEEGYAPQTEREAQSMIKLGKDIYNTQAGLVDSIEDKVVEVIFEIAEKPPAPIELIPAVEDGRLDIPDIEDDDEDTIKGD